MMKILHLCDSLNPAGLGGYESYLHYLSKHLAGLGHESIVVTQAPRQDTPASIAYTHYTVRYLQGNLLEARKWIFYSLPEKEREREASQMFRDDDLEKNVESLQEQLLETINETRPDIIHAHSTYVIFNRVLMGLREKGRISNIPLLITIHGRPKPLVLPGEKKTTDYDEFVSACPFDLVLGVSKNVTEVLRYYLGKKKIVTPVRTCYLGIDLSVFTPQTITQKRWDIAFMGRLERMKAVDLFPEMLINLRDDFPNLRFLMTGEGLLREGLLKQFKTAGVSNLVDYLGVVDTKRVPELINQSRIFIYPSREEPFGLSIVEAMACGVPVITTNVFGPSEIVTHNENGLMISPDSLKELVDSIRSLLQDDNLQKRLGVNARRTAESRFNIKNHSEEMLTIYDSLVHAQRK
ncbi:MAG: glycosyltransferase family 4 protein [Candidatus Thorarchaeota archaeon]|nr:glycosyltransferase family 4 protein [Candidatus Thorarchaeota archaeon]